MAKTQTVSMKAQIGEQLYEVACHLGAKSDLLRIVGSYGDTLPDKEVPRQLRQWNDRKATEVTGRSKLQSKMKEFVDRAHQRALKQNEKAGKLMPKRRKTAPEKPA